MIPELSPARWLRRCLADNDCPDDLIEYHAARIGIDETPFHADEDTAHEQRVVIRRAVDDYTALRLAVLAVAGV